MLFSSLLASVMTIWLNFGTLLVFQHDVAIIHIVHSCAVWEYVDSFQIQGLVDVQRWPLRSPDLILIDFFSWTASRTSSTRWYSDYSEDVRERICTTFHGASLEVLKPMSRTCESNLRLCLQQLSIITAISLKLGLYHVT